MIMYVYLDSSRDVVAHSVTELALEAAQSAIPSITTIVENAPEGLLVKGEQSHSHPFWHRLIDGEDGTMLEHYEHVDDISPLQTVRMNEIDARTVELVESGFEFPAESGNIFSLSERSQIKITNAYLMRNRPEMVYPVYWNSKDNTISIELADAEALESYYLAATGACRYYLDSGTALKNQIRAATTVAEVDAVVDNR
jgi:hypothetical protein